MVDVNISDYDFLKAFKNEGERVHFRLVKEGTNTARNEDCILSLNSDEYPLMQMIFNKYQKRGFAVYFVVNSGGQKKNEITKVTAHFQNMDFGKVPKLDENGMVIKNEMDLLLFKPLQEALTNYFSQFEARKEHADRSVNNLPKVMRIPNYKHLKNPQDPFTIKCIYSSSHQKYTQYDIAKAIGIDLTELKISTITAKDSRKQSIGKNILVLLNR